MAQSVLDVVINPKGAVDGAQTVRKSIDHLKGSFLELSAKVFAVSVLLQKAWHAAKGGAEFEETLQRLNRQMGAFGSNAERMVGDMKNVTRGIVSISEASNMASRALAIGLNPDQVITFTKAAHLLKEVMGTSLPEAFDNIANATVSGRTKILGNIGVYIDMEKEVRKLALAQGKQVDQITKQDRAMLVATATARQLAGATARLSDGLQSSNDKLEAVEAKWKDFWLSMETGAKTAVVGIIDAWSAMTSALSRFSPSNMSRSYLDSRGIGGPSGVDFGPPRESFGPPVPANLGEEVVPQTSSFVLQKIEATYNRIDALRNSTYERALAQMQTMRANVEEDGKRELQSSRDIFTTKIGFLHAEEAMTRGKLQRDLESENTRFAANIEGMKNSVASIEEDTAEKDRHADKVQEIQQQMANESAKIQQELLKEQRDYDRQRDTLQREAGERAVASTAETFRKQEQDRDDAFADQEANSLALIEMAKTRFASDARIADMERTLLREQLAFKLKISKDEVDLIIARQKAGDVTGVQRRLEDANPMLRQDQMQSLVTTAAARDVELSERANDDFFAGWKRGLDRYTRDRDSAFGLSAQMAQRTGQAMEQGFQTFFFDVMSAKFTSFKDVLLGVFDFTKQIIAQIVAQLVTLAAVKGIQSFFSPGGGALVAQARGAADPSLFGPGFASGGSFRVGGHGGSDTTPIGFMASPGELVNVQTPGQAAGSGPVNIGITINTNGQAEQNGSSNSPNMTALARDIGRLVENKLVEERRPGGLLAGGRA